MAQGSAIRADRANPIARAEATTSGAEPAGHAADGESLQMCFKCKQRSTSDRNCYLPVLITSALPRETKREKTMRKLIFALAVAATGTLAYAVGTPASAMTAAPVTGMSDVVKQDGTVETVHYRRRHWHRHRHHHWRHHYRRCWWHRGHRHCRWGW
jgi:hypothetical protein